MVLLLATLCLPFTAIATATLPKVAESVRPLEYNWTTDTGESFRANTCTVTSINKAAHLWLTAAHCVLNNSGQFKGIFTISGHEVWPRKIDAKADLAVLYTPDYSLPALKVATVAPFYTDDIVIWGHPLGLSEIVFVRGYVAAPVITLSNGRKFLLFSAPIAPGNSGSAVLNSRNEIVSVAQVVFNVFPAFEPMGGGVLFNTMKGFLAGVM